MSEENKQEGKDMAIRKEDLKDAKKIIRSELIKRVANQVADRNDEGLRRLSKN